MKLIKRGREHPDVRRTGRPGPPRAPRGAGRFARRTFLRGAGGAVVGLPLLSSLGSRSAKAQGAPTYPQRFVVMCNPNGVIPSAWFPTAGASETEFTLNTCHQALEPYKDKLVITSGIEMPSVAGGPGEPHQTGMGGVLTGWPLLEPSEATGNFVGGDGSLAGWGSSISVDQRLAQAIGGGTQKPSLQLGVRCTTAEVRSRISYLGPAAPLPPINDPVETFNTLFSDFDTDVNTLDAISAQRRSVLDAVLGQFDTVSARISSADRLKLEAHADMVREMEMRLGGMVSDSNECKLPTEPVPSDWDSETNMPQVLRMQMDLLAMALTCDMTRVVTLQISNAQNHIRYPWLDKSPDNPGFFEASLGDGHALSHAGPSSTGARDELIVRDTWLAEQLAYLCSLLNSVDEGDGTLLDNTLILWCNELAVGNTHSHVNMPFVMAGSAGGAINTGRFLEYPVDTSHCELLYAILQAYGVDEPSFGDPAYCPGALSGLLA